MHNEISQDDLLTSEPPNDPSDTAAIAGGFGVGDALSANWVVRRIVEARAYGERVRRWAQQECNRAAAEERRLLFLYETQLQAWTVGEVVNSEGRSKSVNLPAGRIGFRTVGPKLVIDDVRAVLRWAKAVCPAAVIVTERLDKTILNARLKQTGDVPDRGARVVPEREKFFIR